VRQKRCAREYRRWHWGQYFIDIEIIDQALSRKKVSFANIIERLRVPGKNEHCPRGTLCYIAASICPEL
jgi:hypothetical protein